MDIFNAKKEMKKHLIKNDFNGDQANALVQFFEALTEVERKNFTNTQIKNSSKEVLLTLDSKLSKLKNDLMNWVIAISGAQVIVYLAAIFSAITFIHKL